ncbi:hypothetical protein [Prosthecobacter sp.]|nr:hypothetical protein [Prosthecobacter sp.]
MPTPPLDDENAIAEQLVDDGLEEADHDIRVASETPPARRQS